MKPGDQVRLRLNPTRRGVLQRAQERRSGRFWLVSLGGERPGFVRETQLELVPSGPITPLDLLATGEYGAPSEFRRLLTHIRVSGHAAEMLYSMEATNTDFKAYQFKPVIKILESPTGRVLLADEVGLGKTIEAGLIWTELRSRFNLRRLLVLCPKPLREKWRRELANKFGLDAAITDAPDLLARLKSSSRANSFHLIASFSSLIPRKRRGKSSSSRTSPADDLRDHLLDLDRPCFDLLIVDEAHHGRNPLTSTHRMIEVAVDASEYCAFLSATPVHNKQEDLLSLLRFLDPDTFVDPDVMDRIQAANEPLIRARDTLRDPVATPQMLTGHLDAAYRKSLVSDSEQLRLIREDLAAAGTTPLTAERRSDLAYRLERVNLLGHIVSRTRRRDVDEDRALRDVVTQKVQMAEVEEAYYGIVTHAVGVYAERNDITHGFLLSTPQRQMASCFAASVAGWFHDRGEKNDWPTDDEHDGESVTTERPLIAHLRQFIRNFLAEAGLSIEELESMLRRADSKYRLLRRELRNYLDQNPEDKVVLFSTYRGTVGYLSDRLREDDLENLLLQGGQDSTVEEVLSAFRSEQGPRILVSTEVGAEGVDLQFCRLLVNYDLPWNPMRVEQRIGRLDRIGQTADKIIVWTLLHEETIDFRIHEILFRKLDVFRKYLGDCEEVVAQEIRELTRALLSGRLTEEEQAAQIERTALTIENVRRQEMALEEEAPGLTAYGDYILDRVSDARSRGRWLSAEDIYGYVTENLRRLYPGTRVRLCRDGRSSEAQPASAGRVAELDLAPAAKGEFERFVRRDRERSDTRLWSALGPVRCRFSNRPVSGRGGHEEVITQFHPVVRFLAERIDDPGEEERLAAAVSLRLDRGDLTGAGESVRPGTYVLVVSAARFEGLRSTTHVRYAGERIEPTVETLPSGDAESLAAVALGRGQPWPAARGELAGDAVSETAARLFEELGTQFERVREEEQAANDDRLNLQISAIDRQVERKESAVLDQARRHREQAAAHLQRGEEAEARQREGRAKRVETRLRNERERLEGRKATILTKRRVRYNPPEEVAAAVIMVTESEETLMPAGAADPRSTLGREKTGESRRTR